MDGWDCATTVALRTCQIVFCFGKRKNKNKDWFEMLISADLWHRRITTDIQIIFGWLLHTLVMFLARNESIFREIVLKKTQTKTKPHLGNTYFSPHKIRNFNF